MKKIKFLTRSSAALAHRCRGSGRTVRGAFVAAALLAAACGAPPSGTGEAPLAVVGEQRLYARDFHRAFALRRIAHPGSLAPDAPGLREARERLLEELVTELLVREHAWSVGIAVSDPELESAVEAVRAQYPPGLFEQTLVEAALPLADWKERLRSRLLLETVWRRELAEEEALDSEELRAHYERHFRGKAAMVDSEEAWVRLREMLVADLRRKKREEAFSAWVEALRRKTPVWIDEARWEAIASGVEAAEAAGPTP